MNKDTHPFLFGYVSGWLAQEQDNDSYRSKWMYMTKAEHFFGTLTDKQLNVLEDYYDNFPQKWLHEDILSHLSKTNSHLFKIKEN